MKDALFRAVVGPVVPRSRDDDTPAVYRTQLPVPPAPPVSEAEVPPITDASNPLSLSIGADHGIPE